MPHARSGAKETVLRLGTRGSRLALAQARAIAAALESAHRGAGLRVELVAVTTRGDRDQRSALQRFRGPGAFVKELERALQQGRIDLAVHSLKDLPIQQPPGLVLAALTAREDVRDVAVTMAGTSLAALPRGARVGTGSPRRRAQLALCYPQLRFAEIRGNVETRLRKVAAGRYDATVLAYAGLKRLGLQVPLKGLELPCPAGNAPFTLPPAPSAGGPHPPAAGPCLRLELLPRAVMLPAPGQGVIAVECRARDLATRRLAQAVHDAQAAACVRAERACLAGLGGGCHLPLAAYATVTKRKKALGLYALLAAPDGSRVAPVEVRSSQASPEELGQRAARLIAASTAGQAILEALASRDAAVEGGHAAKRRPR